MFDIILIVIAVLIAIGSFPLTVFITIKLCSSFHWAYFIMPLLHLLAIIGVAFSVTNHKPSTGDATPGVLFAYIFIILFIHFFFTSITGLLFFFAKNEITLISVAKWGFAGILTAFLIFILLPFFHDIIFSNFILNNDYENINFINEKNKKAFIGKYSVNVPFDFVSDFDSHYLSIERDVYIVKLKSSELDEFWLYITGAFDPEFIAEKSETLENGTLDTKIYKGEKAIGIFKNRKVILGLSTSRISDDPDLLKAHEKFKVIVNNLPEEKDLFDTATHKNLFYLLDGEALDLSKRSNPNISAFASFSYNFERSSAISLIVKMYDRNSNDYSFHRQDDEDYLEDSLAFTWIKHIMEKWSTWSSSDYSYSIRKNHLLRLKKRFLHNIKGKEMIYDFYLGKDFVWMGHDTKTNRIVNISMRTSHRFDISWAESIKIWDSILNSFEIEP